MKNECCIVKDILPLYEEKLLSDETVDFVRRHLNECPDCRAELEQMENNLVPIRDDTNIAFLKKIKKNLLTKKIQTVLLTVALFLAFAVSVFGFLTAPKYYLYTPDILNVTTIEGGSIVITFDKKITGYRLNQEYGPDGEEKIYHIEAWSTIWDVVFARRGQQFAVVKPENNEPIIIYYTQNHQNGSTSIEDALVYGEPSASSGGAISCPGLSLAYLLLFAGAFFVVNIVVLILLRKRENAKLWLERILLIPLSYVMGHFCVLRFRTISYSVVRDFFLIMIIAILLYCAMLFALNIYYIKKEKHKTQGLV